MPARAAPPAWPPESRWRRVFPGDERQLGLLRRWLCSLLPECPARDDVVTVASELGANAIRHSASGRGDWFAVEISRHATTVRVAVADSGAASGPYEVDDPVSENGRGLVLVRALSAGYGARGDHRGRLVWADIAWADPASPPQVREPREAAIHDGEASLARQFGETPAWFGRSTHQWWALTRRHGLISAPTAHELAARLSQLAGPSAQLATPGTRGTPAWEAQGRASCPQQPATLAPPSR